MNLYLWNRENNTTSNWHDEGGLVVIVETIDRAREMILEKTGKKGEQCSAIKNPPDMVRACDGPEYIAIHPDAGCC